jgi:hypothetical protein
MDINDLTYTSIETITAFDPVSGDYMYTLDELQNFTINNTEEKSDVTGRGGRKLSSLKKNKACTISGANGYVSSGLLENQTGSAIVNGNTYILWTDYLSVTSHEATTAYKATGTAGAEIKALYVRNSDGTVGQPMSQVASIEGSETDINKFAYDPATKKLSFTTLIEDNTQIVVQYMRKISAPHLENYSDTYSGKATLYVDALAEDKCSNIYRVQFYFPKVDLSGEFSIEFGDNQSVHNFEATTLASGCGIVDGGHTVLWTYTVFGANTEDAA